ncbi:hypothetical protein LJC43_07735 [Parabacteroides sp. OttesenSCG-928-G21]|nr:hypothetical protein [Parabacteroides sp. OttesenSCG-928-G21]
MSKYKQMKRQIVHEFGDYFEIFFVNDPSIDRWDTPADEHDPSHDRWDTPADEHDPFRDR